MRFSKRFKENALLIAFGVILFFALTNYTLALDILGYIKRILYPVILGAIIAFILNVPMSAIEKHLFKTPKNPKRQKLVEAIKRPCSIILTILIAVGIIVLLLVLVIPSLAETISSLTENVPSIVKHISDEINGNKALSSLFKSLGVSPDSLSTGMSDWLKGGLSAIKNMDSTVSFASAVFSSIVDFVLGIFFSIYILAQKETLKRQLKKVCSAFLPERASNRLSSIEKRSVDTFGRFLVGQSTDAALFGALCTLGCLAFGFPDPVLIGVVVAVSALVPLIGATIGMLIGFLLICVHSFSMAIGFVVFLLVLMQVDANFIYPRIVGNSVGLPPVWVLFAVTVGGRTFGVLGMFLAVPICAIVYSAFSEIVNDRLENRQKPKDNKKGKQTAEPEPAGSDQ
ncbi:MAG: AI-2E family transporter [Ruminococcus sp.]|nr:AI-2E family transporter [Ruminococcus sp.]